jgi:hypothetical protein
MDIECRLDLWQGADAPEVVSAWDALWPEVDFH